SGLQACYGNPRESGGFYVRRGRRRLVRRRADAGVKLSPVAAVSPALEALYRGDVAEGERLLPPDPDVFEASAFGLTCRLAGMVERDPGAVHRRAADDFTPLHLAS